ncbi:MAG: hypothetical protein RQM92_06510 [Candidatus Syntrophopropionicum ammoniitolerans]
MHYSIIKEYDGQRTVTKAKQLNSAERLKELAKMLDGNEITEITMRHARQMLGFSPDKDETL